MSKYALVFVEGFTEKVFFDLIKQQFFKSKSSKNINLKGNYNINNKILAQTEAYSKDHPSKTFSVLVCIDRESRHGVAPVNMDYIKNELKNFKNVQQSEILLFEAVQDIESWFFHDIDTIFEHLRVEKKNRKPSKYFPVEKFNNIDLSNMFKKYGNEYKKGIKGENFIKKLDLDLIRKRSKVLDDFCRFMENF